MRAAAKGGSGGGRQWAAAPAVSGQAGRRVGSPSRAARLNLLVEVSPAAVASAEDPVGPSPPTPDLREKAGKVSVAVAAPWRTQGARSPAAHVTLATKPEAGECLPRPPIPLPSAGGHARGGGIPAGQPEVHLQCTALHELETLRRCRAENCDA